MVKQSQPILKKVELPPIKQIKPRHSEEVNEILTRMPNWLIRWGITVFFFATIGIFIMSWFIKYPDVVKTRLQLTTTEMPVSVLSRTTGALSLQVNEKEWVEEGALIGYLKNAANFQDIQELKKVLRDSPNLTAYKAYWQLGELQPYFNALISSLKQSNNIAQGVLNDQSRKTLIQQQIAEVITAEKNAKKQVELARQDYAFAKKMLKDRYQVLLLKEVISREEYEQHARSVLLLKGQIEQKQAAFTDIKNRLILLKKEQQNLDFDRGRETITSKNQIEDTHSRLKSQLALWEQKYLLTAPIAGKIEFVGFAKNNMFLQPDQEFARIIPDVQGELYGELFIPSSGFGKVDTGQVVLIELDHYPKKEFGIVEGTLQEMASIKAEQGYKAKVQLSKGLTSTFHEDLTFQHGMEGTAQIVTEDVRLFSRFVYQLRALFM